MVRTIRLADPRRLRAVTCGSGSQPDRCAGGVGPAAPRAASTTAVGSASSGAAPRARTAPGPGCCASGETTRGRSSRSPPTTVKYSSPWSRKTAFAAYVAAMPLSRLVVELRRTRRPSRPPGRAGRGSPSKPAVQVEDRDVAERSRQARIEQPDQTHQRLLGRTAVVDGESQAPAGQAATPVQALRWRDVHRSSAARRSAVPQPPCPSRPRRSAARVRTASASNRARCTVAQPDPGHPGALGRGDLGSGDLDAGIRSQAVPADHQRHGQSRGSRLSQSVEVRRTAPAQRGPAGHGAVAADALSLFEDALLDHLVV